MRRLVLYCDRNSCLFDLYWLPTVSRPLFINRKKQTHMINDLNLFYLNNFRNPSPVILLMKIIRHLSIFCDYRICAAMLLYTYAAKVTSVSRGSPKMGMQKFPCGEIM